MYLITLRTIFIKFTPHVTTLDVLNFEVQFAVLQTTDSSEQCFAVSLKQSWQYLALYGKMKIECSSKFEMKLQLTSSKLSMNIGTLSPQHCRVLMNIRFDCKVSSLSEVFGMDEIGIFIAIVPRFRHLIHA